MDRVTYNTLGPRQADFDMVRDMMIQTGVLNKKIPFTAYTDTRFADQATVATAWKYEPGTATAK
jgi:NitT/TauT family transport system substrate-binding protein